MIYLVSCNLSEIFIVTILGFLAPASTLLPLQILFLNMVTDVFPALALGVGSGDETVMEKAPRDPKKNIVTNKSWVAITLYALAMTLSVILAVIYCKQVFSVSDQMANNIAFITLAFAQLFHVFNMSSTHSQFFVNDITRNKFVWLALIVCSALLMTVYLVPQLRLALSLTILPGELWMVALVASFIPLVIVQLYKFISGKLGPIKLKGSIK